MSFESIFVEGERKGFALVFYTCISQFPSTVSQRGCLYCNACNTLSAVNKPSQAVLWVWFYFKRHLFIVVYWKVIDFCTVLFTLQLATFLVAYWFQVGSAVVANSFVCRLKKNVLFFLSQAVGTILLRVLLIIHLRRQNLQQCLRFHFGCQCFVLHSLLFFTIWLEFINFIDHFKKPVFTFLISTSLISALSLLFLFGLFGLYGFIYFQFPKGEAQTIRYSFSNI